jgi:hypothetical protein
MSTLQDFYKIDPVAKKASLKHFLGIKQSSQLILAGKDGSTMKKP